MNRNRNNNMSNSKHCNSKPRRTNNKRNHSKDYDGDEAKLVRGSRDNDPNWYFTDGMLADQVSQLSFQNIEGLPVTDGFWTTKSWDHATIVARYLNPCPGVQGSEIGYISTGLSAINQAGFKMFSMLSAYTGRTATYGPQDLSTMILALGELISTVEFIRRAFGCMFLWSERNRNFPIKIISMMGIDAKDLMTNYSNYRTRFNGLVQRINQIPIPRNIAYFDKCASLYEKIYMDSESPMATLIMDLPATSWILDETTYSGGTILKTTRMCKSVEGTARYVLMNSYLNDLELQINALLNSSTLNVVYTDILNLATKMKVEFWKFDYLNEAYSVQPEYNVNYLLQLHNTVVFSVQPTIFTYEGGPVNDNPFNVTPYNDVVPDADNNRLLYNPMFGRPLRRVTLVDSITPQPSVEDRIEMLRFTSGGGSWHIVDQNGEHKAEGYSDFALPDHYCVSIKAYLPSATTPTNSDQNVAFFSYAINSGEFQNAMVFTNVDWMPFSFRMDLSEEIHAYEMVDDYYRFAGDTNFYTWVSAEYLEKIIEFIGIALYSLR